jgi:two-component system, cell cycle sensor histidine kinase and response regulator CckA
MIIGEEVVINTEFVKTDSCKGTVLIVDDEETICTITKLMVENAGYHAHIAFDGMEAIQIMSEIGHTIDCILLDHSMPNMNGEKTYEILQSKFPHLKVILMSGYNLQEISESFAERGFAGYIQKPYSRAILINALSVAINS